MNQTENIDKKLYTSIDVFKFLAAILIVAIHTNPFAGNEVDYYFTCFCRIGVPFFFVATSFFFFRKSHPDIKAYSKRLLLLYLLWFIIETPLIYYNFFINTPYPLFFNIINLIRSIFFSNTWGASWFVMACVIAVNLVYFMSRKYSNKVLLVIMGGVYIISLFSSSYYGIFNKFSSENIQKAFLLFCMAFHPSNSFFVALIYVVIGKIFAEATPKFYTIRPNTKILMALFVCIMILGYFEVFLLKDLVRTNDAFVILPIAVFILFFLLLNIDIPISPNLAKQMRDLSILIYFIHPILVDTNTIIGLFEKGPLFFSLVLLSSFLIAFLIVRASDKMPYLKYLY